MEKVRSSAVVVLVAAVLLLAGACSSSGSDKAKTDTGSATTSAASDTGKADTGSGDTGTSSDTGTTTGGGSDSPGHGNDADGLKSAAEDFSKKLVSSDPSQAYAYLSADCKAKVTEKQFVDEIKQSLELLKQFATNASELAIGEVQTKDVSGGKGQVAVELLGDDGKPLNTGDSADTEPSFEAWVYESGDWHPTSCGDEMGGDTGATFDTSGFSSDFT
jgi:hypothetical protein